MTDNRTTELRRKLTELGKSYRTIDGKHENTAWNVGELTWWYDEDTETGKTVLFTPKQYDVTPEQAIAVTLGSEREQRLEGVLRDWIACEPRCTNRSCGDCEHDEDEGCALYRRMCELGAIR